MRVLVVEDERTLADAIARGLRREGLAVDVSYDGSNGHEMALVTRYDVVVLDRDLPGVHGDRICADLVKSGALTRVLMLTASGTVADRVEGLQLGADDYLPKPFAFDELVARVRALGRRATPAAPPVLVVADVVLDQTQRTVTRAGEPVDLTRKEFGILEELLKARGGVVSSEELLERVWDANTDPFTTTVRVTMMTLRKKLGDPPLIETVVGVGYRVPAPGSPLPTAPTSSAPVSAVPISPVPPTPLPPLASPASSLSLLPSLSSPSPSPPASPVEPSTEDVPVVGSGALTGPTLEAPLVESDRSPESDRR